MIKVDLTLNIFIKKITLYFPILNKSFQIGLQNLIKLINQLPVSNEECSRSIFVMIF